ncbi:hypothetical protein [Kutzneria sp. 744]|uniref:hypothetical protein n=1 Tax=Kutzneria sp. (strain 744) TaxID=345341 RepID=UPI0003EEB7F1|nr:hypothetical protein [Kutzneria sp. 744]EWM19810.1 hypothetical protein KUTG_10114 [Kutzneria sp. 744]
MIKTDEPALRQRDGAEADRGATGTALAFASMRVADFAAHVVPDREQPLIAARLRPSMFGRTVNGKHFGLRDIAVHLFPLPTAEVVPSALVAVCGFDLQRDTGELVNGLGRIPCEQCLLSCPAIGRGSQPLR